MVIEGAQPALTLKDFATDQEVRWCPGCGNYSILTQVKRLLPTLGIPKENFVFISGIGCSSRFPYYVDTYGFHGIHGRAPAVATGLKSARPDLSVWIMTGDGDALSIGGNHFLHTIRRNVDVNIIMFNNEIYGLTKGQYSPTSQLGKTTKSSPFGTIEQPIQPISIAIGAEATFVARAMDVDVKHLAYVLDRAAHHKGTSFVEIYQDCNIFNHGAFFYATKKETKPDAVVYLEHRKPLIFGQERNKGIRLIGMDPEVVELSGGITEDDLLFHDEQAPEPSLAYLLSRMHHPEFPEPMGVFRAVRKPCYEYLMQEQVDSVTQARGPGDLASLFETEDCWTVE